MKKIIYSALASCNKNEDLGVSQNGNYPQDGQVRISTTVNEQKTRSGGFTGNHAGGDTKGCRFDGSKNTSLDESGLSWMNDNIEMGSNDISNTLE